MTAQSVPIEASGGPGLKLLLICPRSQPVEKGFGSALDMALQSCFSLFLRSSTFPIVDLTVHGQLYICQVQCQRPCSGKFVSLGNHPILDTRKISTVEVVKARCQKNSTAKAAAQEALLWDCYQLAWSKMVPNRDCAMQKSAAAKL